MKDSDLADELIKRLNEIVKDPDVSRNIWELLETRIPACKAAVEHPTIQTVRPTSFEPYTADNTLGFLGLLNGLVGTLKDGPRAGWGHITAVYEGNGSLTFKRTQ